MNIYFSRKGERLKQQMNQILNELFIILTIGTKEKQTMDSFLLMKV